MKKIKDELNPIINIKTNPEDIYKYLSLEITKESELLGETSFIPLDIYERQDNFFIEVEIPGIDIGDINIYLSEKNLIIEGIKQENLQCENKINFFCMERKFGPFKRIIQIPFAINSQNIKATYLNGILTIAIPKNLEERRKKTLKIDISEEQ